MGPCDIVNSAFLGTAEATGKGAGGIVGGGYSAAAGTPVVQIHNCYVAADIKGADWVGGILGAEAGHTNNVDEGDVYGVRSMTALSDNHFYGTLKATAGDKVGGVVGYYVDFTKREGAASNYYLDTSGATRAIGGVKNGEVVGDDRLGRSVAAEQFADGTVLALLNAGTYKNWVQGDAYPILDLGKVVMTSLEITVLPTKTQYYIGEELDLSGLEIKANYSNGGNVTVPAEAVTVSGYDKTAHAVQTLLATYNGLSTTFQVTVLKPVSTEPGASNTISAYFTLKGAPAHGGNPPNGVAYLVKSDNLETWIPRTRYTVDLNATVADLIRQALDEKAWTYDIGSSGNYLKSVTRNGVTLAEFTNGPNSGWVYTYNGVYSLNGIAEQFLENDDSIALFYTDDWTQDDIRDIVDPSGEWSGAGGSNPAEAPAAEKPETEIESNTVVKDGEAVTVVAVPDKDNPINGGESARLVVNVDTGGESVSKITAEMPKEFVAQAAESKSEIEIRSEVANVLLPEKAVAALAAEGKEVAVKAEKNEETGTYVFTVESGGKTLETLDGGIKATIPVPEAQGAKSAKGTVAMLVHADGTEEVIKKSYVIEDDLLVPLAGSATIRIADNAQRFGDVAEDAWYADAVAFVTARGLFNGTAEGVFDPGASMTRAMLVTVLHRLEDLPDAAGETFSDVGADKYYAAAVAWASANGIVAGLGDGRFAPDAEITREQLAAILYRYGQFTIHNAQFTIGDADILSGFTDADEVSDWAGDAMIRAVGAGIISGRSNPAGVELAPKDTATRAEVAAILERFVEKLL